MNTTYKTENISKNRKSMTIILGARCKDGIVLVADSKITDKNEFEISYLHDNKITGELTGILTGFSGDRGTFETFRHQLRDKVSDIIKLQLKEVIQTKVMYEDFGVSIDKFRGIIYEIQNRLFKEHRNYEYEILVGVSSRYFSDRKSILFHSLPNGTSVPIKEVKVIGTGAPYASYFVRRYWHKEMKMEEFAQLSDLIIRFISNDRYNLNDGVGLDSGNPYPQIRYIPDDPDCCKQYNNGQPKYDCSPLTSELENFKTKSEKMLQTIHQLPFPCPDG
jgi:20S proteasome alpha/beta subunit